MTHVPIREERKVVTALFADVVGSTSLGERLDPEDVREIVGEAIVRIVQAAEALGGTVKDLAGDGALILFGAPVAHEDDSERAVRAGLEIVRSIEAYGSELGARRGIEGFGVRVGIETGLVVLGPVGAGSRVEYGATGDAVNTAARLQSQAKPGTVLVGEATCRAIKPLFDWSEPRVLELKGKAEPVRAWEALAARAVPGRLRGLEGADVVLVGRDRELEVIRSVGEDLTAGRGGLLLVTGEAGVGKSRLLRELRRVVEPEARWLEGRCASFGGDVPYWPFRDALHDWFGRPTARGVEALESRVAEAFADEGEEALPFLQTLLSVELDRDSAARVAGLSAESLQRGIAAAVKGLLEGLARPAPIAVVLEDLHWADPTSLQLTERLLPLAEESPVLIALTSRVEEGHPSERLLRAAAAFARAREVRLDALAKGSDGQLLTALVGEGTLPEAVERRILEEAEGNPFYLEELVRSLMDSGALRREAGGWRFQRLAPVEIPETVEKVILARLDRLSPASREVLDAACVVGRSFDLPLVEDVAGGNGRVLAAVHDLVRLDLIREEPLRPEPEYRFKHALIQEAAYRSLLKRRRRELHLRAAEALETRFSDRLEGHAALVGRHYRAAGELGRALELLHRGAVQSRRTYAVEEAVRGYSEALEVAGELGASGHRVAELRLGRGEVRAQIGLIESARDDLEAAVSGARVAADPTLEMAALGELGFLLAGAADYRRALAFLQGALRLAEVLEDRAGRVTMLSRLCIVSTNLLHLDRALEFGERALSLAREGTDEPLVARALDGLKQVALQLGDAARVEEIAGELLRIYRRHQDLWYLQFVHFERGYAWMATGRWDAAARELGTSLDINRRIEDRGNEPLLLSTLGRYHALRGEYRAALDLARRSVELARDVGHAEWTSWTELLLGSTMLELYGVDEAALHLASATEAAERAGALLHLARGAGLLAWCRWLMGDRGDADRWRNRAEELFAQVSTPPGTAYLAGSDAYLAVARIRLASGDAAGAESLTLPLLAAAETRSWMESIVRGSLLAGLCHRALGRTEAAERRLVKSMEAARAANLPRDELAARGALASLLRGQGRFQGAAEQHAAGRTIVDALSSRIGDESIRREFVAGALGELEEEGP